MIHRWTATWGGYSAELTEGDLTLDRTSTPYITGSITMPTPAGAAVALLNPFTAARLVLTLTDTGLDGVVVSTRAFDLGIRERTDDPFAGTSTLRLASDEALVQDYTYLAGSAGVISMTGNAGAVATAAVHYALPAAWITVMNSVVANTVITPVIDFSNASMGDIALDVLRQAGGRLWCDADRRFYIDGPMPVPPGVYSPFTLDAGINLQSMTTVTSREGEWVDGFGVTYADNLTAFVTPPSAPYTKSAVVAQPLLDYAAGYLQARTTLDQRTVRGTTTTIQAVSDYAVVPGRAMYLNPPDGRHLFGNPDSVVFNYPSDEMTITTTGLVNA